MGRREVETTTKRTIQVCDLCDRDLGGCSPHRCDVCGREAGYCCSTLRLAYDPRRPGRIDLGVRVCRDCELAGREEPTPPMEVWRQASAEWRAKRKGDGK